MFILYLRLSQIFLTSKFSRSRRIANEARHTCDGSAKTAAVSAVVVVAVLVVVVVVVRVAGG